MNPKLHNKPPGGYEISVLVAVAVDSCNTWDESVEWLIDHIDSSVRDEICDALFQEHVRGWVRKYATDTRARLLIQGARRKLSEVAEGASGLLSQYPLPGGVTLGASTKDAVLAAAKLYLRDARINLTRGTWLMLVADSLSDNDCTVESVLNESALQTLYTKACRMAEKKVPSNGGT